jgi:uncharacterized Zn finger protein
MNGPAALTGACSMVSMPVSLPFTEADIKLAAGARSFERGLDYLGAVENLEISDTEVTASVYGNSEYTVRLVFGDQGLGGGCTCPYGRDGFFCKHCVAAGLSVLAMGEDLPRHIETTRAGRQALEAWLQSLSKEELLAELRGLLDEDRDLRRRFELRAAATNADARSIRRAVMDLIMPPRSEYIDYYDANRYASDVDRAVVAIDDLIQAGGAADAIGIAREAIGLFTEACQYVDDVSGSAGDAANELLAVHLRACMVAPPEPVSLGGYLAGLMLDDEYVFEPNLDDYAELLGDRGTAMVRERIVTAYAENPASWRAKYLRESVARAEGDVDTVVAIYAAELDDRGRNHLRIASELDGAGRGDEALCWAERGLREAAYPDQQLVDYLVRRYVAAGRDDDALSLRRKHFRAERTLASYRALRQAATASGVWPAERDEALALLAEDMRNQHRQASWAWSGPVLVDALTDDGDLDAAWAAAKDTATEPQWLRLADASIDFRPADALAIYHTTIGGLKTQTGDDIYRRIASLLLSARACHQAMGTTDEFRRYLAALRLEQKRKRSLMKILDQNGL